MFFLTKDKIKEVFSKIKPSKKFLVLVVFIFIGISNNAFATGFFMTPQQNPAGAPATTSNWTPPDLGFEFLLKPLSTIVANAVLPLSSAILNISGRTFNYAFQETVLKMGDKLKEGEPFYQTIITSWSIFRDVSNILIVFVLIYISIKIILGFGGEVKRMIPTVILVSILINFSLFFAQLPIDISNVLSISIYEDAGFSNNQNDVNGLSEVFLTRLGLSSAFNLSSSPLSNSNKIIYGIICSVLIFILSFVLLISSLFLIARFIILIIILITSAAAIGSLILPQLKNQIWSKWSENLIGQSLFPPIFIFMLALSLKMLLSFSFQGSNNTDWISALSGNQSDNLAGLFLTFFLTIGFLIASLIVAKSFANKGGGYAGKISTFMGGAALGVSAFAARRVGGNIGGAVLNSAAMKNLANSETKGFKGFAARTIGAGSLKLGEKATKGTWDIRNTSSVSKLLGVTGTSLGSGSKKTVESVKSEQKKSFEAAAKRREYTTEQKEWEEKRREKKDKKRTTQQLDDEKATIENDFNNSNSQEDIAARENLQKTKDAKTMADSNISGARGNLATAKDTKRILENRLDTARQTGNLGAMNNLRRQIQDADEEIARSEKALVSAENQVSEAEKKLAEAEKMKADIIQKKTNAIRGYVDMEKTTENYYRRKTEGLEGGARRFLGNWTGGTSNSVLGDLYRKQRKGKGELDKLVEKLQEEMKKNGSTNPPTPPTATT